MGFCFYVTGGLKLRYKKPPLTFPQQADKLLSRGLIADRDTLIQRLKTVNYYRLSAYWHTFRDQNSTTDALLPGTEFDVIWRRYTFDRRLRLLVIDAIERIEVAVRTRLTNIHTLKYGAFGYLHSKNLGNMSKISHAEFLKKIRIETGRSRDDFVQHFKRKYTYPLAIKGDRMFGVMTVLYYMLKRTAPQSNWKGRFEDLLDEYSDIPMVFMGFPDDWRSSPIWK